MNFSTSNETMEEAVKEALGLRYLHAGNCLVAAETSPIEMSVWVDYIWVIYIRYYYKYDLSVGVASMRENRTSAHAEYRGFLVPTLGDTHVGKRPHKYVELKSEEVSIKDILQCWNLLLATETQPPDSLAYTFSLHTFVPGGAAIVQFDPVTLPVDVQSQKLWSLVTKMVADLALKTGLNSSSYNV